MDLYMSTKTKNCDLVDNFISIQELIETKFDINFIELGVGSYGGEQELSIRVFDIEESELLSFMILAKEYNQESILVVDADKTATLMYANGDNKGKIEVIGKFKEVKEKPEGDFSYFGGSFYIVE